jgi:predicted DNA-binding transcriptional regulator YafY
VRADRLVAVLLFLQSRGRVTAAEVAAELEISERTARRDLEGLAMAGIPVYSQPGRGGGWSLVGGARTDLSGLTAAEARTLFLVAGPSASATPQIKAALRKLVRALPEPMRAEAEAAASAVMIDPTTWDRTSVPTPTHLEVLQQAVVDGVQVRIVYRGRDAPSASGRCTRSAS